MDSNIARIRVAPVGSRNTHDITVHDGWFALSWFDPDPRGTGKMKLVQPVGMGMVAAGADGLILEVHPNPEHALCDGAHSLTFDAFAALMAQTAKVAAAVGKQMQAKAPALAGA